MALHPVTPAVEQQWTVHAPIQRLVDGLLGSRVQGDLGRLVALAENPQGRLVPLTAGHRIEIWYAADGDTLYLLSGGGRSSDWVQNLCADPAVLVEVGGDVRRAHGRAVEGGDEAERARSLVFAKYAPRYGGDLTGWRDRALPVAIDLAGT